MKKLTSVVFILITFTSALAQNQKDRIEIGVQSTALTLFHPDFPADETYAGLGARFTYNLNRSIAAEAEINFFPQKPVILTTDGKAVQAQFGVKAGRRFEKWGLFGKFRPGFLSVDRTLVVNPAAPTDFPLKRHEFFTMDLGGVLEFYPSRRMAVRFEGSDLVVRHQPRFQQSFAFPPAVELIRPAKFNHNFQFTAGVNFRLGDFPPDSGNPSARASDRDQPPRYEIGVQFTSMSVDPPSSVCNFCATLTSARIHTEPGFGGRFTFNLTDNIGLEAEGNYFTRDRGFLPDPSGHMFQGQFGAKVGKRFDNWGLFGKARPGFVAYTQVSKLVGTHTVIFAGMPFVVGDFRTVKQYYPSLDVGGVVEFYVSHRWMARFDFGDTIIRYGELQTSNFFISDPILTRPAETHHNFQFTSGIGFRF
jgi:hypothetical protein